MADAPARTVPDPPPLARGEAAAPARLPAGGAVDTSPDPQLDPARIIATIRSLRDRIEERFPGSGLGRVCAELLRIADHTVARVRWVARPNLPLRLAAWTLAALLVGLAVGMVTAIRPATQHVTFAEFLQAVESGINDVLLLGAGIFFVATAEARIKRRRALGFLRELRALAHVVDMHQLTKDPASLLLPGRSTPSSPRRTMTRYELARYLDYCSEMLALDSKLAALYAQHFDDPVVLSAVDEVERLTTGLSQKVWQKITILNQASDEE